MDGKRVQQELLTAGDVAMMIGMGKTTFRSFLGANPEFPKPIVIGVTAKKHPIKRWRRRDVEDWVAWRAVQSNKVHQTGQNGTKPH